MRRIFKLSLTLGFLSFSFLAQADDRNKVLFKDLVTPILNAKCASCHGAEKQKGKLRLDSLEAILKGGSEGVSVVAGKVDESSLIGRVLLPLDDDEHMPPESKPQLTKEEQAVLSFWIQSGAKGDATIAQLKPAGEVDAAIKVVLANPPKSAAAVAQAKIDPAKMKVAEKAIEEVGKTGASLMAIAQNTPDLRFSALNVAREYGDKNLEQLKAVADQVKWVDLAGTQITDAGLTNLAGMKNLTRLHLENTKISDAGLEHLKGLENLEYLNLYGTQVSDAGLLKLAGLKKLQKVFVWQTKVTDAGAKKLAATIPSVYVNTGWKEPVPAKPVVVAAATAPAKKPAPAPAPAPKKPAPAPKTSPKKPTPPPAAKSAGTGIPSLDKAITELKVAVTETAKLSEAAAKGATDAVAASKAAADASTKAKAAFDAATATAADAKSALDMLEKAAKGSPKTFEKALTELKAASAEAAKAAASAKAKSDAAVAAAAVAMKKIETEKTKAAKAAGIAQQTKAALDTLMKTSG